MNQYRLNKTSKKVITHTSLLKPYGKYHIEGNKENYESAYSSILKNGLGIVEQHNKNMAEILVYDIDFKFINDELQKEEIIEECKNLICVINELISQNVESAYLESHICMKNILYIKETNFYKVGIHIYYPEIFLDSTEREQLYALIVEKYEEKIKKNEKFYKNLFDKKIYNIIDSRIISKTGILVYGACKENNEPYKLVSIRNENLEEVENTKSDIELSLYYSLHKNKWLRENRHNKFLKINEKLNDENDNEEEIDKFGNSYSYSKINEYRNILKHLSNYRSDNFTDWINVGICLSNIEKKSKINMLDLYNEFSKKSSKYKGRVDVKKHYQNLLKNNYNGSTLTEGTLYYMLKTDNIKEFNNILSKRIEHINEAYELAKIIHEMYSSLFVCIEKGNFWYYYDNQKWTIDNSNTLIHKNIIEILIKNDKPISRNLIEEIIYFCKILFSNQNFESTLECNNQLVCFENGVFDLDKNIFRKSLLEDYCYLSTKYPFFQTNDFININNMLQKILPNKEIRDYFLYHLASCLHGHKNEQIVIILTGSGANGKSLLMSLMSKTLGEYYKQGNITLLSRKRSSSANASPDLIALKDKRMFVLNETEHDDTIQTSMLKQLSGGDEIEARDLYKSPITFKCKAKMFICCNDLPKIASVDQGTWRRLRVIQFPSKFVDNPNPKKKNEYKKDINLERNLDDYVNSFMNLLLNYYEDYKKNNFIIKEPEEVKLSTESYKNVNDDIEIFLKENVEYCEESEIDVKVLYTNFKIWYSKNFSGKCKNVTTFKEMLNKKDLLDSKCKIILNYKLKENLVLES